MPYPLLFEYLHDHLTDLAIKLRGFPVPVLGLGGLVGFRVCGLRFGVLVLGLGLVWGLAVGLHSPKQLLFIDVRPQRRYHLFTWSPRLAA